MWEVVAHISKIWNSDWKVSVMVKYHQNENELITKILQHKREKCDNLLFYTTVPVSFVIFFEYYFNEIKPGHTADILQYISFPHPINAQRIEDAERNS